jgi:hypothetical protein
MAPLENNLCMCCDRALGSNEAVCSTCVKEFGQNAVGVQYLMNKIIERGYSIWLKPDKVQIIKDSIVVAEQDWPGDFVALEAFAK